MVLPSPVGESVAANLTTHAPRAPCAGGMRVSSPVWKGEVQISIRLVASINT